MKEFERFLTSSFFLKRNQLPVLFAEIKKYFPSFKIDKETVYYNSFGKKPYNEVLMRKYQSELNRMIEQYFVISALLSDKLEYQNNLAKIKYKQGELEELGNIAEEAILMLNRQQFKNSDYYSYKYVFESFKDISKNLELKGSNDIYGSSTITSFVDYSAITVLKYYSKILNNMKVFKLNVNIKVLDEMTDIFYRYKMITEPISLIYYNIIQLQKEPLNEAYFYRIKAMLKKYEDQLEQPELRGFYTFLHNYCYERIDKGNIKYVKERYEILQIFMNNGYCFTNGCMRPEFFSSMVLTLLILKKLSLAEEFIKKFSDKLDSNTRVQQLDFAYANLLMHKKQYSKSLEYLSKITFNDIFEKLRTKVLYLMVYYEAGMYDSALYHASTFRKFILNNKNISGFVVERHLNFIKQCVTLIKFRNGKIKEPALPGFEKKTVMNRLWLTGKIEELK